MPCASIIPDGKVILPPLEAYLSVVILRYEVEEIWQQDIGLVLGDAIDALGEPPVNVHGVPSRHSYYNS